MDRCKAAIQLSSSHPSHHSMCRRMSIQVLQGALSNHIAPATTKVAAWITDETAVGPSIASGNQLCTPTVMSLTLSISMSILSACVATTIVSTPSLLLHHHSTYHHDALHAMLLWYHMRWVNRMVWWYYQPVPPWRHYYSITTTTPLPPLLLHHYIPTT